MLAQRNTVLREPPNATRQQTDRQTDTDTHTHTQSSLLLDHNRLELAILYF